MNNISNQSGHPSLSYYKDGEAPKFNVVGEFFLRRLINILVIFTIIILRPRGGKVGDLGKDEVEKVYEFEAKRYDGTHHLTTRGQDLEWRRKAGFFVLNFLLRSEVSTCKILDICTGTGLTIKEICSILDIRGIPSDKYEILGLDYSQYMLKEARKKQFINRKIEFARGDVTKLCGADEGFANIEECSIDIVTQMFGIGGVDKPEANLLEVLKVLKLGGQYFMIDMHAPLKELAAEWFPLGKWFRFPRLESRIYWGFTVKTVLKRKWAWRDTTPLFEKLRYLTYIDPKSEKCYGFKVLSFEYHPERWWFSIPIMAVAKIIVEKEEISSKEANRRNNS